MLLLTNMAQGRSRSKYDTNHIYVQIVCYDVNVILIMFEQMCSSDLVGY